MDTVNWHLDDELAVESLRKLFENTHFYLKDDRDTLVNKRINI